MVQIPALKERNFINIGGSHIKCPILKKVGFEFRTMKKTGGSGSWSSKVADKGGTRVSTEVTFWHSAEYGIEQKSLQKSKNSAEFRVGGIPWTP